MEEENNVLVVSDNVNLLHNILILMVQSKLFSNEYPISKVAIYNDNKSVGNDLFESDIKSFIQTKPQYKNITNLKILDAKDDILKDISIVVIITHLQGSEFEKIENLYKSNDIFIVSKNTEIIKILLKYNICIEDFWKVSLMTLANMFIFDIEKNTKTLHKILSVNSNMSEIYLNMEKKFPKK